MTPAEAAALADLGSASAVLRGRSEARPYVPVVVFADDRSRQVLGLAFATRAAAIEAAQAHIDRQRAELELRLASPRHRALRQWHGVSA